MQCNAVEPSEAAGSFGSAGASPVRSIDHPLEEFSERIFAEHLGASKLVSSLRTTDQLPNVAFARCHQPDRFGRSGSGSVGVDASGTG